MIQVLAFGLLAVGGATGEGPQTGPAPAELVKELLPLTARGDLFHKSRFFVILSQLARLQKVDPEEIVLYRRRQSRSGDANWVFSDGRALVIESEKRRYLLVILGTQPIGIPGLEAQQLILMDESGKYLDKIACGINSRYGKLQTEVPPKPADDGAQLVIRFVPRGDNKGHEFFWHTINHRQLAYTFDVKELAMRKRIQPAEWVQKGLCRIAIRDGKFVSLFPKLTNPDFVD